MRSSVVHFTRELLAPRQAAGASRKAQSADMNAATFAGDPVVSAELLARLDGPGPRYTSYPTADRFVDAFGPADYERALQSRVQGAARNAGVAALSLYVHIPFCESVCYYCA
jgi:oxygen-independent coproporphyrinogen-3 oxidase